MKRSFSAVAAAWATAAVLVLGGCASGADNAPTSETPTPQSEAVTSSAPVITATNGAAARSLAAAAASRSAASAASAARAAKTAQASAAAKARHRAKVQAKRAAAASRAAEASRAAARSSAANEQHSCTTTSSGNCIQGGQFCPQASEDETGYDANGRSYVCRDSNGDGHPHWEIP